MPIKKTDLKETAGVKLTLVEDVTALGTVKSTRPNQPRVLAQREAAEDAFDFEVVASLLDPVVQRMVDRG